MGMFAGNREYYEGDMLTESDIVIPVFELEWHNGHRHFPFLWDEYVWSALQFPGMEHEVEDAENIHVCSGGMGAAVNCMLPLVNAADYHYDYTMGMSGVSPQSPGVGAFTPYYGRRFHATKDISAGAELYADYGEEYFSSRSVYKEVPLFADYERADKLLARFQDLSQQLDAVSMATSSSAVKNNGSLRIDLYNFIKSQNPYNDKGSRVLNALPANETQVETVLDSGGTKMIHYNASVRSLEWLEENGQCMDNIKDGISTIPHAGRGAFANRFIPKGGLVAPAPLIHMPNRFALTMFDSYLHDNVLVRNTSKPIHQQLLLNYCFGHNESTLLLCPYGLLTSQINHSKQPNTKIEWTQNVRHAEWMEMPLRHWASTKHSGISFDFVALRDIQEDEEILIDYGDEWEQAWQHHVQNYDPPRPNYIPAYELNRMETLRIRTMAEESYETDGLGLYCRATYVEVYGLEAEEADEFDDHEEAIYPCRVRRRMNDNSYLAELFDRKYSESVGGEIAIDTPSQILLDVPRDAFYFRDILYQREHHQTWSFRHDMRIPDSMFPEIWKNKKAIQERYAQHTEQ